MAQHGYPLPPETESDSQDEVCVSFRIPNNDAYIAAAKGAIYELTKWYNWERNNARRGKETARRMRDLIGRSLTVGAGNCPDNYDEFPVYAWLLDDTVFPTSWFARTLYKGDCALDSIWQVNTGFMGDICLPENTWAGHSVSSVLADYPCTGYWWLQLERTPGGTSCVVRIGNVTVIDTYIGGSNSLQWYALGDLTIQPGQTIEIDIFKEGPFIAPGDFILHKIAIKTWDTPITGAVPFVEPTVYG